MLDHLRELTDGIVNRTLNGEEFVVYKQIHGELQKLSPEEFEASKRGEFLRARGAFERLVNPHKHQSITGSMIHSAAEKLRPVLDHYVGAALAAPAPGQHTTHNYNFNSPTAGCAFGDGATVKADNFLSHQEGDQIMGDKISIGGDAIGSAVGTNASVKARDIITQVQKTGLDTDLKQKVAAALEELTSLKIDEGDKTDVADDVEKLTKELDNPAKDESRIKKIWNRIQSAAPTAAAILAGAASLGKILGLIK